MSKSLFRTKSIEQIKADAEAGFSDAEGGEVHLRRSLGTFDVTMLGIAAIVGAGIFAMVGQASHDGGPAVVVLFIFAAIACGFAALCYAEFAARIPIAGSAYTYAYASFGELAAWIIGWDLIVEYAIGNIAVAISWSDYFTRLLVSQGIHIPAYFTMDFLSASRGFTDNKEVVEGVINQGQSLTSLLSMTSDQLTQISDKLTPQVVEAYAAWTNAPRIGGLPLILDLPALGIVILITLIVYIGIRESKTASNIMVILKLAVIFLVIIVGAFYINTDNWTPFAPNGFTGVMSGVAAVFFAYIGFDALATTAEECKEPYKTLPRGMIYSLLICTALYVVLALVLTGMVNYTLLNVGDPLAFVFGPEGVNIPWISGIVAVSAIIAIATVLLVFQLGQPRLWMAMSRDGLLPRIFSSIHPKFRTPWFSTIITGILVAVPALFMNLSEVTDLAVIGTLFAFTLVCAGVLVKDEEFGRKNRFVPYINSQFITPILVFLLLLGVVYFQGVNTLNAEDKPNEVRISTEKFEKITKDDKYSAFSFSTLTNGEVYSKGFGAIADFFTVETSSEEIEATFTLPRKEKFVSFSPTEKIVLVDKNREKEIKYSPDQAKAESSSSYFLWITPFVNETKTITPNLESPTIISTADGDLKVSLTQTRTEAPWLSAASHKIPYTVFFIFLFILAFFSFTKKFTLIPVLGIIFCTYLMSELGITNWIRFGVWLLVGLIIYFFYSYKHSKLHQREDAVEEAKSEE
jgi:amino acid transporter